MADKRKPSQYASFTIRDILRISTSDSNTGDRVRSDKWKPSKSKHSDSGCKRVRTIFTQEQLDALEANFERQQYMIRSERVQLAVKLNLQEPQVKVWFQNRRIKWRKQQHEITMAKIRAYHETSSN